MTVITKKNLQEAIDEATADIISAVTKGFETVATKEELREVKEEILEVKADVKDIKRSINDLKADLPTPEEYKNHDKRISRLETAVFPQ